MANDESPIFAHDKSVYTGVTNGDGVVRLEDIVRASAR